MSEGASFGAPSRREVLLAEAFLARLPHFDQVRFVSSGTEAVMSAIRLARGFTGRDLIVKFSGCYHGHTDSLLVEAGSGLVTLGTPSSAGVPNGLHRYRPRCCRWTMSAKLERVLRRPRRRGGCADDRTGAGQLRPAHPAAPSS